MRIVNLSHVVNLRLSSDVPAALDRRFGAGRWHYVGWEQPRLGLRRSPFANPYSCRPPHHPQQSHVPTQEAALRGFRRWLWEAMQAEEEVVLAALRALRKGQVLVCWCQPNPCHASVIVRAANWQRDQERLLTPTAAPPRVVRERTHAMTDSLLFDLDQGYLKVTSAGHSRFYALHDWVWPHADSTPAIVREAGTVRQSTAGAMMARLTGRRPLPKSPATSRLELSLIHI